jgi:quercetin dioxygenase-like cupin family protein
MRPFSVVSLFGTASLALLATVSPGVSETILTFEPPVLAPCKTAFVQNGSCPNGEVFKVIGAIEGLNPRKTRASLGRRADVDTHTIGQTPPQSAGELETVKTVFERAIPTIPGKRLTAIIVNYPPGGKSPPHRHAASAFIYAFVLSGAIRTAIGSESPKVYQAGDSFYEEPGAHHRVSENVSKSQPASLLAVFIFDAGDNPLTLPDANADKK